MSEPSKLQAMNKYNAATLICVWPECGARLLPGYRCGPLCTWHATSVVEAMASQHQTRRRITHATAAAANRAARESEQATAREAAKGTQPGWVYYVRVGDRVKIGYSADVKRRMRAYPPGSHLLAAHPGTAQLETEMHQRFAGSRAAGREWFRETADLTEHIGQVVEQFGEPTQHRYHFRTDQPAMRAVRSA